MRPAAEQITGVRFIPFAAKLPILEVTLRAEILRASSIVRRSATDAASPVECLLDPSVGLQAGRKAVMGAGTARGLRAAFQPCCLLTADGASQHSSTPLRAESGGSPHCATMVAGHIRWRSGVAPAVATADSPSTVTTTASFMSRPGSRRSQRICAVTATSSDVCGGDKVQVSWCGSPCADSRADSRRAVTSDVSGAASTSCRDGAAALARLTCTRPFAAVVMGRRDHLTVEAGGVNR